LAANPFSSEVTSVAYASAEYEMRGPPVVIRVETDVAVVVETKVVVEVVVLVFGGAE
jgi:hypothetical protein